MTGRRVIPSGCKAARCEGCRKLPLKKRMIVSGKLQVWFIALEEFHPQLIVWEEFWAWSHLGGPSDKAQSLIDLEFRPHSCNTTLEECGDGIECSHSLGWFWVVGGGAACTPALENLSITLRHSVKLGQ